MTLVSAMKHIKSHLMKKRKKKKIKKKKYGRDHGLLEPVGDRRQFVGTPWSTPQSAMSEWTQAMANRA